MFVLAQRSYLRRKSSIAYGTFERPFFGMAPIVNFERGVARERFETDVAGGVSSGR